MKRTELKRKTPLRQKAIKRKDAKPKPRPCTITGSTGKPFCKRQEAPVVISPEERYCKTHAGQIADTVCGSWVKYVRDKQCVKCGTDQDLEWAHIRSRGAHPSLHWMIGPTTEDPGNTVTLCRGHHFSFTSRPSTWDVFVEENWPGLWTHLVHQEIANRAANVKVDLAAIIVEYRDRLRGAA